MSSRPIRLAPRLDRFKVPPHRESPAVLLGLVEASREWRSHACERGDVDARFATIRKLAEVLGVEPRDLMAPPDESAA